MTQDEIIRMAREAGFSMHNGIVTGGVSDLERFWNDVVIEGRNIQIFKDDAERANEFDPDWDETLELVEEIKRLAIENERLRHGEIKYEDWEFNPMTGESLWGKQPVRTKDLTDDEIEKVLKSQEEEEQMTYSIPLTPESHPRTESTKPSGYRLLRKKSGELVLQCAFEWSEGTRWGIEWRDISTEIEQ